MNQAQNVDNNKIWRLIFYFVSKKQLARCLKGGNFLKLVDQFFERICTIKDNWGDKGTIS